MLRFDKCAASYDAHAQIQKSVAAWCIDWVDEPTSMLSALELGAGTGLLTRHLAQRGFASLRATDLSSQMIARGARAVPEVQWALMDAWAPSSPPVDRLYACSLLQWAPEPLLILERWKRLLAPTGRLLAALFIQGTLDELFPPSSGFCALEWRTAEEWLSNFRRAGWHVRRSELRQYTQSFPSPLAALRSLHGTGATEVNRASVAEVRRVLRDYRNSHENAGEEYPLTWRVMRIEVEPLSTTQSSSSSSRAPIFSAAR